MNAAETDILRLSRRIKSVEDMPGAGEISLSEVGAITLWPMSSPPDSWLICDGSAVSRTEYADLFAKLCENRGNAAISIGSAAVVTLNGHGFSVGDSVFLTTSGVLPSGLLANILYFVRDVTVNSFRLSATRGGPAINTSGSQSGAHYVYACPWGIAGAQMFNLPNLREEPRWAKTRGTLFLIISGKRAARKRI